MKVAALRRDSIAKESTFCKKLRRYRITFVFVSGKYLMRLNHRKNKSARHNDLKTKEGESLLCAKNKPVIYKLPSQTRLKLSIHKWNWSIGEGPCGICHEPFDSCCATCQIPGDECPIISASISTVAIGICRHAFHMHCIVKWTKSQKVTYPLCPLCRQKWEFATMEHIV
ncbi:zinc finger, C3HC4 type [Onchocerca flexuosa]|uniref:Anaphase-promoting complex subunit 11 n=1 Tax=Onchocerca flexuosa TaxID=387005 RepID=A0A238C5J0_9BILA|nr:zinc finger, C3HC4 type [Onchocerca flexuosa]